MIPLRYLSLCVILGLLLLVGCTLSSGPDLPGDNPISTGEAPPDVLTPSPRTPSPSPTPDTTCRAINDDVLAMRVSTDIAAAEVTILAAGTTSRIVGRRGDNAWWRVTSPAGQTGWVDNVGVRVLGDCSGVPVADAPTLTPSIPTALILANSLNVRRGPSIRFNPPLGRFSEGDEVEIVGLNVAGDWLKVPYGAGTAWISGAAQFVEIRGNTSGLPVDPGPPTPTATNTPIPATPTPTLDPNTNYLRDGGMEGAYVSRGSSDLNLPDAWQIAVFEQPRTQEWQNLRPVGFPHRTPPEIRSGALSLNLSRNYGTFTAAVYQQATVPANITVRASAWAYVHTCDPAPAICNSDPESGARVRVGIDPTGGTNPNSGSVVWSGFISPHDSWGNVGTSAQAQGGTVTVFLYATQDWPRGLNNVYWDDAALNVGG